MDAVDNCNASCTVSSVSFNIVLVHPEIPQNTGNIGRLCVSTGSRLHLIKPLGFSLDDKYIQRAGLDYWQHLDLSIYDSWEEFLSVTDSPHMYFFSTKTDSVFWDASYRPGDFLIFGNEGSGFPRDFYELYKETMYTVPMPGKFYRSLNLANSVAVVLYEGIRRNLG